MSILSPFHHCIWILLKTLHYPKGNKCPSKLYVCCLSSLFLPDVVIIFLFVVLAFFVELNVLGYVIILYYQYALSYSLEVRLLLDYFIKGHFE